MEVRGPFMRSNRGMRPPYPPMRGRPMMMMDPHVRHLPPRPHLMMRGAPPPPFTGRPMMPTGRPRGPVMLPHRVPLPGSMGPLGPRGMLPPPRPMLPLPPRVFQPDANDALGNANMLGNKELDVPQNMVDVHMNNTNIRTGRLMRNNQAQQHMGQKKNRKDNKIRRIQHPGSGPVHSHPTQNIHPGLVHPPQGPPTLPSQQHIDMHQAKNVPSIQSQMGGGMLQSQPPPQIQLQQNAARGGRNGMMHRNRGNAHAGNRGNMQMNYAPNISNAVPARPNAMMNGPPVGPPAACPYGAPPPSYPVPPPQVSMKRGAPPVMNVPSTQVIPPKRICYEALPNGYPPSSYQQAPPPQQTSYPMSYEMPPPVAAAPVQVTSDMYGSAPASSVNMAPVQSYNNVDYGNYQMVPQANQTYASNGNVQYSNSYDTGQSYSNSTSYSTVNSGYDSSLDYSSVPTQTAPVVDSYASQVDAYGYSTSTYTTPQTGYEDYSSGYVDNGGYAHPVPDQSYGQTVNTYPSYSY